MTTHRAESVVDSEMLRRAANACRNMQKQAVGPREWFDWVPRYLDCLAELNDGPVAPQEAPE